MNLQTTVLFKINRIAFEKMRLVGTYYKKIAGAKCLHNVTGDECASATDYVGNLRFSMAVKMLIKMRQEIFLDMNRMIPCYRNCKLYNLHLTKLILPVPMIYSIRRFFNITLMASLHENIIFKINLYPVLKKFILLKKSKNLFQLSKFASITYRVQKTFNFKISRVKFF